MYENICGLTLRENGFKSFYVNPEYTDRFSYVDMEYDSPKGKIAVKWERNDKEEYTLYVTVPFDTTAEVVLPNKRDETVCLNAGTYCFQ
jgi:hypothetical protein